MRAILDTHIFFWWMKNDARLPERHRVLIASEDNQVCISAVTGWEIAIKVKLGKWPEAAALLPDLEAKIAAAGFDLLPLTVAQAERGGSFDLHHRDPFDRLLAAQALDLDLSIATLDPAFSTFGCRLA